MAELTAAVRAALPLAALASGVNRPGAVSNWYRGTRWGGAAVLRSAIAGSANVLGLG